MDFGDISLRPLSDNIRELVNDRSEKLAMEKIREGPRRIAVVDSDISEGNKVRVPITIHSRGFDAVPRNFSSIDDLISRETDLFKDMSAVMINYRQLETDGAGIDLATRIKNLDPYLPVVLYHLPETAADMVPFFMNLRRKKPDSVLDVVLLNESSQYTSLYDNNIINMDKESSIDDRVMQVNSHIITELMQRQFYSLKLQRKIPIVVKIGGSHFDMVYDGIDPTALTEFCKKLLEFAHRHTEYAIFVNPGGGPPNDYLKDWFSNEDLRYTKEDRESVAMKVLEVQAKLLHTKFGEKNAWLPDPARPGEYYLITDKMFDEKPIMIWSFPPYELRRAFDLSPLQSDSATISLAAWAAATRALFTKHVGVDGGIYNIDPKFNIGRRIYGRFRQLYQLLSGCPVNREWPPVFSKRTKLLEVSAIDYIQRIAFREGEQIRFSNMGFDGTPGHLLEREAAGTMARFGLPVRVVVSDPRREYLVENLSDSLLERTFVSNDLIRMYSETDYDYRNSLSSIVQVYHLREKFPGTEKHIMRGTTITPSSPKNPTS